MLGLIIAAASLIGSAISAKGQKQAGKDQQAIADYNAMVTEQTANYNADLTLSTAEANAGRVMAAADFNAAADAMNARTALRDSAVAAGNVRFNNRRVLATQRARMAAGGVVGETGSPLITQVSQAGLAEMRALETELAGQRRAGVFEQDALTQRWQADEQAKLMRWQAGNEAAMTRWAGKSQANLDRLGGASARRAGNIGAVGTILQGAGNAAAGYYGMS